MARHKTRETQGWLFLKKDKSGNLRKRWHARYMTNGRTREVSLCPWQGTPPGPGATEKGLALFEQSRERAREQLKKAIDRRREADEELRDAQRIHDLRYGGKVESLKVSELETKWDELPHKEDMAPRWRELVHTVLRRFEKYMAGTFPKVTDTGALSAKHFKGFLESVDASGVSARTWNYHLTILRSALRKLDGNSRGFREYLLPLKKKAEATIHRRPFDNAELDAIFAAAKEKDPELYPVLVAAACTALRRGDVCRLRWDTVDLEEGFASVKTSKTSETVDIPIFPPFRAVLEEAARSRKKSVSYVWPKIATAYKRNPDGLDVRLRRVLETAGFVRPERADKGKYPVPEDEETAAALLEDGMDREGWTATRKAKARKILELHFKKMNGKEIAETIGIGRSSASEYLHAMEDAGHMALVSPPKRETPTRATLAEVKDGEKRARRGSLCGWHSFRTTFCTLALANGVPMEILRKITGHRTAEIVLKHYDRRGREAMRKAIGEAMPSAIAGAIGGSAAEAEKEEGGKETARPVDAAEAAKTVNAEVVEVETISADVARVSKMLTGADAKTLAKIAKMLAKAKGSK